MAWNMAGAPAATVRCGEADGLPISIQAVAKPWRDLLAVKICAEIEAEFGGFRKPSESQYI
jgi:amidase